MQTQQVELQPLSNEYLAALRPVRFAKTIAWLAVWVAVATQLVCFVLVRFTSLLAVDAASGRVETRRGPASAPASGPSAGAATSVPVASSRAATRPDAASTPAAAPAGGNDPQTVAFRRATLGWLLAGTKYLGPLAALALMVFLIGAAQISLVGRLGGAGGFASAFVWSVFLLLLVAPWRDFVGGWLPGALTDLGELDRGLALVQKEWAAGQYTSAPVLHHLAVFLLYPFIAILVWVLVGLRFAQGIRKVHEATTVAPPVPPAEK